MSPRATVLCHTCYEKACLRYGHHEKDSNVAKKQKTEKYTVDEFVELINNNSVDEIDMRKIMKATGSYIHDEYTTMLT